MGNHAAQELIAGTLCRLMMVTIGTMEKKILKEPKQTRLSYLFNDNVVENNVAVIVVDHVIVRRGYIIHNHGFPG